MDTCGLHLHCDRCGSALREPGGLLLGVPDAAWQVRKWHLCRSCTTTAEALLGLGHIDDTAPPTDGTGPPPGRTATVG